MKIFVFQCTPWYTFIRSGLIYSTLFIYDEKTPPSAQTCTVINVTERNTQSSKFLLNAGRPDVAGEHSGNQVNETWDHDRSAAFSLLTTKMKNELNNSLHSQSVNWPVQRVLLASTLHLLSMYSAAASETSSEVYFLFMYNYCPPVVKAAHCLNSCTAAGAHF